MVTALGVSAASPLEYKLTERCFLNQNLVMKVKLCNKSAKSKSDITGGSKRLHAWGCVIQSECMSPGFDNSTPLSTEIN